MVSKWRGLRGLGKLDEAEAAAAPRVRVPEHARLGRVVALAAEPDHKPGRAFVRVHVAEIPHKDLGGIN